MGGVFVENPLLRCWNAILGVVSHVLSERACPEEGQTGSLAAGPNLRCLRVLRFGLGTPMGPEAGAIPTALRRIKCVPFVVLKSPLYQDFIKNFGERRAISIPWWTLKEDGHKSTMPRNCTIDYKVNVIAKYVRWHLLGYRKYQRLREADLKGHEMHMGFGAEETRRCKENPNPLFIQ